MSTSLEVLNIEGDESVVLGLGAAAPGDNAIAIGATQGDPTEGDVLTGTFANGDDSIAVGRGADVAAAATAGIAIGLNAKATAAGAVQIGAGTNASTNTLQFMTTQVPTDTNYNTLVTWLADRIKNVGGLAIDGADATQFETANTIYFQIAGIPYSQAANTGQAFTAAHVVTALLYGVILIQMDAAGTMTSKVPAATQAYTSAALALAALPAPDASNVAVGYIAIHADAGDWTANTDDMTDGSDLTTATFNDTTIATAPVAI